MSAAGKDVFNYYDRDAGTFAARYDSLRFEDVHGALVPFLPKPPAAILDVGAGSGRDARALAKMGYSVLAVDPVASLHAGAPDEGVVWVDDCLPELRAIDPAVSQFDFILCSAVLMLLGGEDVKRSIAAMARLLTPGGKLAISIRGGNPGEPAELFHDHPRTLLLDAAEQAGLKLRETRLLPDALGRAHQWQSFVFERGCPQPSGTPAACDRNNS